MMVYVATRGEPAVLVLVAGTRMVASIFYGFDHGLRSGGTGARHLQQIDVTAPHCVPARAATIDPSAEGTSE